MICTHCQQEIGEGDRKYHSRQAGMQGFYHWKCFVKACHKANKAGEWQIELSQWPGCYPVPHLPKETEDSADWPDVEEPPAALFKNLHRLN